MKKNQFAPQTIILVQLKWNKQNGEFNFKLFLINELSFNINSLNNGIHVT